MKPPPFLIGAALVFWGWQSGFEIAGIAMALVLEGSRWLKLRWDLSDSDFWRIWTFCAFLFLATIIYAFTSNEGPGQFRNLFANPNLVTERNAGTATGRTAAAVVRWMPMSWFLFMAAQAYSSAGGVPVQTMARIQRWRSRMKSRAGEQATPGGVVDVSYFFFALCLMAASVHASETASYFWGLSALVAWALWAQRPRGYRPAVWAVFLSAAVVLGYFGQHGMSQLQGFLGNLNIGLFSPWRGRHDPTQSRTDLGRIGRIKTSARIVIRLESKEGAPPPLLREASYRRFKGVTWLADVREADYLYVLEEPPNSGNWNLLPGKTHLMKVGIGCYLQNGKGLLPLPTGTSRLENLSANILTKSPLGAVLELGPGVVVFDALYGPGLAVDSDPDPTQDLAVAEIEKNAIDAVIRELNITTNTDLPAALKTLNKFFVEKFSYAVYQPMFGVTTAKQTPLTRFLLRTRQGHCEYFATAGVLLLRRLNIPARYAVGYAVHEGSGGKYVVRQRDAHAWCLAWDDAHKLWRDVDFTPPSWVQIEAVDHGWLRAFSDFWSRLGFELSKFRWGQTHLRQYLLWALVPILLVLLYQIIFKSRRQRRAAGNKVRLASIAWPGLDSEFYRLERALTQRGFPRARTEPLSNWLETLSKDPALAQLRRRLSELLWLHYRYRFDPEGLTSAEREALRRAVAECLEEMRAHV